MDQLSFKEIATRVFKIVKFTPEEQEKFLHNDIAKACTMAPIVCKSENADRYAIQNALTFVAAVKDDTFNARPHDFKIWIGRRLQPLFNFPGNDLKMQILHARLAKVALNDYQSDVQKDSENGKYNPIASGDVSHDASSILIAANLHDDDVDALFSQEQSNSTFWWI